MKDDKMTDRQRDALRRSHAGVGYYWPTGHDILVLRAMARRGLLQEIAGLCEGCHSHKPGTTVPVFHD